MLARWSASTAWSTRRDSPLALGPCCCSCCARNALRSSSVRVRRTPGAPAPARGESVAARRSEGPGDLQTAKWLKRHVQWLNRPGSAAGGQKGKGGVRRRRVRTARKRGARSCAAGAAPLRRRGGQGAVEAERAARAARGGGGGVCRRRGRVRQAVVRLGGQGAERFAGPHAPGSAEGQKASCQKA